MLMPLRSGGAYEVAPVMVTDSQTDCNLTCVIDFGVVKPMKKRGALTTLVIASAQT
jgi:hypothetical protein